MGADEEGTLAQLRQSERPSSTPPSPRIAAASSKLPGTACSSNSPALSMRRVARSKSSAEWLGNMATHYRIPGLNFASAFTSATSSSMTTIYLAMASTSQLALKASLSRAVYVSPTTLIVKFGIVSMLHSTTRGETALKNIARPVRVFALAGAKQPATNVIEPAPPLALPDKPSIAVLPFQNMSGDQEQEYFADGMVEDIITALSRFKSLFVIARNSSFSYKGKSPDIRQVGLELGVRYVLEGSVRKAGSRLKSPVSLSTPAPAHTFGRTALTVRSPMSLSCRTRLRRKS